MPICGGHSAIRKANADETAIFQALKGECEAITGQNYDEFDVVGVTSQIVAGTNYWVKLQTDKGFVNMKVFRPLPHTGESARVVEAVDANQ